MDNGYSSRTIFNTLVGYGYSSCTIFNTLVGYG